MGGVSTPRRRCVGCGRLAPKSELLRLAAVAVEAKNRPVATFDRANRLPGRGAYVCRGADERAERDCLKLASKRGILQRAFRRAVDVPAELVESNDR